MAERIERPLTAGEVEKTAAKLGALNFGPQISTYVPWMLRELLNSQEGQNAGAAGEPDIALDEARDKLLAVELREAKRVIRSLATGRAYEDREHLCWCPLTRNVRLDGHTPWCMDARRCLGSCAERSSERRHDVLELQDLHWEDEPVALPQADGHPGAGEVADA